MIDPHWVIVGAFFNAAGTVSYVVATVKGNTRPNRISWFLWALAPLIAFSAQLSEGVGLSAILTLSVGLGPLAIFLASFVNPKSYWKLNKFDYYCGALSVLALLMWWITGSGSVAIAFGLAADFLAGVPMLAKAYRHPETESATAFLFGIANSSIALLTIKIWDFNTAGFPIYIFIFDTTIALIILKLHRKPRITEQSASAEAF